MFTKPGGIVMKTDDHVALENEWATSERWRGIKRGYTAADVVKLRGSVEIKHTLAERGAKRLWELLHSEPYVRRCNKCRPV
jgi:isocitrate lyase